MVWRKIITPILKNNCSCITGGTELSGYDDENRRSYRKFVEKALSQDDHAPNNWRPLPAYTPEQDIILIDCFGEIGDYHVHTLPGHENCKGITLENLETVILSCPNKVPERIGCFDIFSPVYGENGQIIGPEVKVR